MFQLNIKNAIKVKDESIELSTGINLKKDSLQFHLAICSILLNYILNYILELTDQSAESLTTDIIFTDFY